VKTDVVVPPLQSMNFITWSAVREKYCVNVAVLVLLPPLIGQDTVTMICCVEGSSKMPVVPEHATGAPLEILPLPQASRFTFCTEKERVYVTLLETICSVPLLIEKSRVIVSPEVGAARVVNVPSAEYPVPILFVA